MNAGTTAVARKRVGASAGTRPRARGRAESEHKVDQIRAARVAAALARGGVA